MPARLLIKDISIQAADDAVLPKCDRATVQVTVEWDGAGTSNWPSASPDTNRSTTWRSRSDSRWSS